MATTEDTIRILGVSGSLREASHNARLLQAAARLAPEGVHVEVFRGLGDVEPFDEDDEAQGEPAGVSTWRRALVAHDAVMIMTPEYNGSIPGQLKNALDWASRTPGTGDDRGDLAGSAMYRRPVAVASASTGQYGAIWAQDDLRRSLGVQGARVVAEPKVAVPKAQDAFHEVTGDLLEAAAHERLRELVESLVAQVRALRAAGVTTSVAAHVA